MIDGILDNGDVVVDIERMGWVIVDGCGNSVFAPTTQSCWIWDDGDGTDWFYGCVLDDEPIVSGWAKYH